MNTLTDEIKAGIAGGPLVPYDPDYGLGQYSGLKDLLVELDPPNAHKFPSNRLVATMPGWQRKGWTKIVVNYIQGALDELPGDYVLEVDSINGTWWGLRNQD